MRSEDEENIIAILLADVHLTLKPPIWRSAETNWLETQKLVLLEICALQREYEYPLQREYEYPPIICAGDICEWHCSPELINFALNYLPDMYAIPGQHDLPLHRYDDIYKSAYLTLVKADKIQNILPDCRVSLKNIVLHGFPFGNKIKPCPERVENNKIHIAVVHQYVWIKGHSYFKAQPQDEIKSTKLLNGKLMGYDIIVYGDNHSGFQTKIGNTTIFNCGTLMRRRSDEINYKPQVGLLLKSGKVIPHYLDISKDKYLDIIDDKASPELDMSSFMNELTKLGNTALDFRESMKQFFHSGKTSNQAKQIILRAMEK